MRILLQWPETHNLLFMAKGNNKRLIAKLTPDDAAKQLAGDNAQDILNLAKIGAPWFVGEFDKEIEVINLKE